MRNILIVGAGGFIGAIARYGVGLLVVSVWQRPFPLATLIVNVTGAFALGLFSSLAVERLGLDPAWRLFVATGVLGAYTTFSTFEHETLKLAETGAVWLAAANIFASVVAGFAAVQIGSLLGR